MNMAGVLAFALCLSTESWPLERVRKGEGGIMLGKWIWELKQLQTLNSGARQGTGMLGLGLREGS